MASEGRKMVRNGQPDSTIIAHVSAYHRASYAERYSRCKLGRVDELFDDNPHGNEMYQCQKGLAQFLIPRGNASKLLEIVEEPFDLLTEFVEVFIIV